MFVSDAFRITETFQSCPDYGERRALGMVFPDWNVSKMPMPAHDSQAWRWLTRRPCAMARAVVLPRAMAAASMGRARRWPVRLKPHTLLKGMTTYVAAQRELSFRYDSDLDSVSRAKQTEAHPCQFQAQSRSLRPGKIRATRLPVGSLTANLYSMVRLHVPCKDQNVLHARSGVQVSN